MDKMKLKSLTRQMAVSPDNVRTDDEGNKIVRIALSSEYPVTREFGVEVLDHNPSSVDLSRLRNSAAFLVGHNQDDMVGVLENVSLDDDKVIRADVRFSRSQRGQDIARDIEDGIRKHISVGYKIRKMVRDDRNGKENSIYRVVDWFPFEASTVAVPADPTVGVGRSADLDAETEVEVEVIDEVRSEDAVVVTEEDRGAKWSTDTISVTQVSTVTEVKADEVVTEEVVQHASHTVSTYSETPDEEAKEAEEPVEEGRSEAPTISPVVTVERELTQPNINLENSDMSEMIRTTDSVTLTDKEEKEYSLSRAVLNLANGNRSGFEFEVSDQIAKNIGRDAQGFYMPTTRVMTSNTTGTGAELVYTVDSGKFVDLLRAKAVVAELGADFITTTEKLGIPRMTGSAGATWVLENGSAVTDANLNFEQIVVDPRQLISSVVVSRKFLQVASNDAERRIRDSFAKDFAVAIDKAALMGTGSLNQPTGIFYHTGVNVVTAASGALPTFAIMVSAETAVSEDNGIGEKMAYVLTPGLAGYCKVTPKVASSDSRMIMEGGEINGYKAVVSNNLPYTTTTGHGAIFGDFSQLLVAEYGALEVIVDPYEFKRVGNIVLTGQYMVDVAVLQPSAFAAMRLFKTA